MEFNVDKQEEADQFQLMGWNLAAMSTENEDAAV